MKNRIRLMIHFDEMEKPILAYQMAEYMESIVNCFMPQIDTFTERVEIQPRDTGNAYTMLAQNIKLPIDFREHISENTCYISISCNNICNERISIYGCIARSHYIKTMMIANEQTINILVDESMWSLIQESIFKGIIDLCRNTSISYVAVDKESIAPKSIYHAQLRFFSQREALHIHPETRVPGIYWTQYISVKMLNEETINDINNTLLPELYKVIDGRIEQGIWIQTCSQIRDDTKEMHKRIYDILKKSSYPLDERTMESYSKTLPWLFEKAPFKE